MCQKENSCTWSNRSSVKIKTKHSTASDVNVTKVRSEKVIKESWKASTRAHKAKANKFCEICSCTLKSSTYFKRVSADLDFVAYYCWQTVWEIALILQMAVQTLSVSRNQLRKHKNRAAKWPMSRRESVSRKDCGRR